MSRFGSKLLKGWHFMRILRLLFAIVFAVQAVIMKDILVGLMSGFFLYQAMTNTGCYGETCSPKYDEGHKNTTTDNANFEEVK